MDAAFFTRFERKMLIFETDSAPAPPIDRVKPLIHFWFRSSQRVTHRERGI